MALDSETRRKDVHEVGRQGCPKLPPLLDTLEEFWTNIPLGDSWLSHTLVVRPKPMMVESFLNSPRITTSRTPKRPLIVLFHGSGLGAGTPLHLALPARLFAERFNATVLCPSYRLAPEHPWPIAMRDGIEVMQFISSQSYIQYGANLSHGFIVAGTSVGGQIAAVIAGLTSNEPLRYPLQRPLTGIYISCSMLLIDSIVPPKYKDIWTSRHDNRDAEHFSTADVDAVIRNMGCKDKDFVSSTFSPINLFTRQGSDRVSFPAAYIQAMSLDPVRDDAIVFEKVLAAHQIPTKIDVFPNEPRSTFSGFDAISGTRSKNPIVEEATIEGIKWLLKQAQSNASCNRNTIANVY